MKHARFYKYYNGNLHQALGSDSVLFFDSAPGALTPRGRHNLALKYAEALNRKDGLDKGYVAYAMFTGANVMNSFPEAPRKLYPTAIEYVALVNEVDLTDPNLWR
jgi:hypothetical protein